MFMSSRTRFSLGLAGLLLTAPLTLGACNKGMAPVAVPAEGMALRYTLEPGQTFTGHVHHKTSDGAAGGNQSTRKLDFDVTLTVRGVDERDAYLVEAVISGLDMTWNVPNLPINMSEFVANSKQRLNGVAIRFFVEPNGELLDYPEVPSELEDEDRFLMEAVLDGLSQAFYVVPDKALQKGESWRDEREKGRKGKLGRYYKEDEKSTFDGLFMRELPGDATQQVGQITVDLTRETTMTTKAGGHAIKTVDKKTILFDTSAGYLASVDGTRTKFDAGQTSTVKFRADWQRAGNVAVASTAGAAPAAEPAPAAEAAPAAAPEVDCAGKEGCEVQSGGDDPCSDEYVGAAECTDPCSVNYIGEATCEKDAAAEAAG